VEKFMAYAIMSKFKNILRETNNKNLPKAEVFTASNEGWEEGEA
jgi:leucyl aminopeptidase (aminopeptidase T)